MNINAVLTLVTQLVPVAVSLIETLAAAGVNTGGSKAVADLIAKLTPIAGALVTTIETIRTQTEAQHPEVWQGIRTDWLHTLAEWNKLNP